MTHYVDHRRFFNFWVLKFSFRVIYQKVKISFPLYTFRPLVTSNADLYDCTSVVDGLYSFLLSLSSLFDFIVSFLSPNTLDFSPLFTYIFSFVCWCTFLLSRFYVGYCLSVTLSQPFVHNLYILRVISAALPSSLGMLC